MRQDKACKSQITALIFSGMSTRAAYLRSGVTGIESAIKFAAG